MNVIKQLFGSTDKPAKSSALAGVNDLLKKKKEERAEFLIGIVFKLGAGEGLSAGEEEDLATLLDLKLANQEEIDQAVADVKTFETGIARCVRDTLQANAARVDAAKVNARRAELNTELSKLDAALAAHDKAVRRADNSYRTQLEIAGAHPELFGRLDIRQLIERRVKDASSSVAVLSSK